MPHKLKPYKIKRDDTMPLVATLADRSGPVDLTASTVVFGMRQRHGNKTGGGSVDVDPDQAANPGLISYEWDAGETDTAGVFDGEFQVTFPDATVQSFPNDGYLEIVILGDIAD